MMHVRKKTFKERLITYSIISLFLFAFIFIVSLISSTGLKESLLYSGALILIVIPWVIINDYRGEKKHGAIHYSRLFQDLYRQGFKKEGIGCYKGLVKQINN